MTCPRNAISNTLHNTLAAVLPLIFIATATAQDKASSTPGLQFDVVSIKQNVNGGPGRPSPISVTPGRASLTNFTLRTLIQFAYEVQPRQLVGEPEWVNNLRFDLIATTSSNASVQQMRMMLPALLEDRFGLVVHRETREVSIYALTLARRDGKLGPNIKVSTTDCQANGARPLDTAPPRGTPAPDGSQPCLILPLFGMGRFQGRGLRMSNIASALNNVVDRTIVDKTGLNDPYEFDLTWTPDQLLQPGTTREGQANISAPSLFTALTEQLGLKLEPEKGQEQVLVVDKVQRPSEN
jgi:uncharacterized protein (TIGR03435 family)